MIKIINSIKNNKIVSVLIITIAVLFVILISIIPVVFKKDDEPEIPEEIIEVETGIDYTKIINNDGKYSYEDDEYTSLFGIDIAEFQDEIDWNKVKDEKIDFIYIRIGRRGATEGQLYFDTEFENYYKGALTTGAKIGVYFFSQAINEVEIKEEVKFIVDNIKDKKIDLPIGYDCEDVWFLDDEPRTANLTKEDYTNLAKCFLKECNKQGYESILYTYPYWAENNINMEELTDYPLWFAHYDVDEPNCEYPIYIWQYSETGKINGISKEVDMNIMFIEKNNDE